MNSINVGIRDYILHFHILLLIYVQGQNSFVLEPPKFIEEPPSALEFSNIFGTRIKCKADGKPMPKIYWSCNNNEGTCNEILDLRAIEGDTLVLFPFSPDDFRPEIHSTHYRCLAVNSFGTVVKDVFVEARIPKAVQPVVRNSKGIRGYPVVLKCEFPLGERESFSTVSWMRDGLPINSNDKYLVVPESNILVLWKLTSQDTYSEFGCKVKEKFSKTEVLSTSGKTELLNIDQIEYPPKIEFKIQKIIVDEQESVTIPCLALGNPKPIVQIYKKSSSGSLSQIQNSHDEAKYGARIFIRNDVLIITSAVKQDRGIYFCNATNKFGTDQMEIHLQVRYSPNLTLSPESTKVEFGKAVEFTCNSDDDETTDIIWLKDGNNLRLGSLSGRLRFLKHNKIQILRVLKEDQGIFQCIGKNQYSTEQKAASLWLGDARPTIIQSFIEQTIIQGEAISLKCKASGWPVPKFTWSLDGFDLPQSERFAIGQHLVDDTITSYINISKVTNSDSGEYSCKASNKLGEVKYSNRMNVFGDLLMRPMQERIAIFGKSITLKCPVGGYPIDSIHWYKNDIKLPSNVNEKVSPNGVLTIENVVKSDTGTLQCTARRQNQVVHGYVKLVVVDLKINPVFHFGNPMVGERVTVICSVTTNLRDVEINWLKDSETLTTGENNLYGTSSNNVKIALINTFTSSLMIDSLNKNNDGLYTCEITLKTPAVSTSWTAKLTVTGDLPLVFKWFKDVIPLATENHHLYEITRFGDNSEILTIKNITREMSGVVTCQVSNRAETVSHSATLFVKAPPELYIVPLDAHVVVGSSLKINCAARGSPHPRIKWLFQRGETGQFLEIDMGVRGVRNTDGILTFNRITKEHMGFYICQASNDVGPPINKRIHVSVSVAPKVTNLQDKVVTEIGKEVVFTCNYEGDQNLTVQWKHDGKDINHLLVEDKDSQNSGTVSKIRIKSVSFTDRGEYVCFVTNPYGHDYFVFSLIAQEQPHPVTLSSVTVKSRSISLSWPIVDFVDITEFILSYRSKNENWKKLIIPGGQNEVTLDKLTPFTKYEFMLSSRNQIGTFKSSDTLIVTTSQEPPSFPKSLLVQPTSRPTELKVSWLSPDHQNGIIKSYQIFYMREQDLLASLKMVPGFFNNTILRDIKPFSYYTITVRANNAAGFGGNTTTKFLSPEDIPTYAPESVFCLDLSSQSIQASWQPPKPPHNGLILGYRVLLTLLEFANEKKTTEFESQVKGPTTTIQGLQSFSNYGLQVSAFTKHGNGPVSTLYFCQTKESIPKEPTHISSYGATISWFYPRVTNDTLKYFHIYFRMHHDGHVTTIHKSIPANKNFYELTDYIPNQTIEAKVSAENIVGEGKPSRSITFRTPITHAQTGRIVSIGHTITVPWKTTLSLPCEHTYSTKVSVLWRRGNSTLSKDRSSNSLTIKNILSQDSSNYSCQIQSRESKDEITYTVLVQAPPKPPALTIQKRNNTIVLLWQAGDDGGSRILGFNLNYRQANGEWEERTLSKDEYQHEIVHNECFKRTYEIFLISYNAIGMSESETQKVEIDGFFEFPSNLMDFVSYNQTTVTLNFTLWNFYECENGFLYTEYKISGSSYWTGLGANSIGELVYLQNFDSEKHYTVKIRVQSREKSELTQEFHVPFSLKTYGPNTKNGTSTLTSYIGQQISIILPILLALIFVVSCVGGIVVYHAKFRNKLRGKRPSSGSGSENENDFSAMRDKYLRECNNGPEGQYKDIQPYATFSLKEHELARNFIAHNAQLYTEEPGRFCEPRENDSGIQKNKRSPQLPFESGLIGKGSSRCDNYRLVQSSGGRLDTLDMNEIYPTDWTGDYELSLIRRKDKSPLKYMHDNQSHSSGSSGGSRLKPSPCSPTHNNLMKNLKYSQSHGYDYEPSNYTSRIYEDRPSLHRNPRSKRRKSSSQAQGQVMIDCTSINV